METANGARQRDEHAPTIKCRSKLYEACSDVVEEDGFEPSKAKPADLQSVPFGHLGTPPYSVYREERWSWWTDSNPRPADYKSAALPAELHQHRSFPVRNDDYYNSRRGACQQFSEKNQKNDRKDETPTAGWERGTARELACALCAGELYPGDPYFELDGRVVCEDCLARYARIYFSHRRRRVSRGGGSEAL